MAVGVYIGSTSSFSGKNIVAAGLGLKLGVEGVETGYFKPVGALPESVDAFGKGPEVCPITDADAAFLADVLGVRSSNADLAPVLLTEELRRAYSGGKGASRIPDVISAYERVSAGRDVVLAAGMDGMFSNRTLGLDGVTIAKALGTKVIVVDRILDELNYDLVLVLKDRLGDLMAGVILNDVAPNYLSEVEGLLKPLFEREGVPVLGVIPRDPLMGGIKVADLAKKLGGRIVAVQDRGERVVENFLIGAMHVENFINHFRKKKNSVVIVGGDRADLQLAAMEGGCPCLVLTGNLYPHDVVLTKAEILSIPVILTPGDTYSTALKVEDLLMRQKPRDVVKVRHGAQRVVSALDFEGFKRAVGL